MGAIWRSILRGRGGCGRIRQGSSLSRFSMALGYDYGVKGRGYMRSVPCIGTLRLPIYCYIMELRK